MAQLGAFLQGLLTRFHREEFLSSDPLEFVHHYTDPWDQEAVALLAALLAYGNVKQIRRSVSDLLDRMEKTSGSPAHFVRSLATPAGKASARKALRGFVHRFNGGEDVAVLLELLGQSWNRHGSLGAHFCQGLDPADENIGAALSRLITEWKKWAGGRQTKGYFSYFLTSPLDGSCCKRWCMFLRWMGRRDSLDPGLWTEKGALAQTIPQGKWLRPDQLVVPLDTHTGRISQYLGLTRRKSLGWEAAVEVTLRLKECNPADPAQYDFALARLGILSLCRRRYRAEICGSCDLLPACQFALKRRGQARTEACPA